MPEDAASRSLAIAISVGEAQYVAFVTERLEKGDASFYDTQKEKQYTFP